MAIEDAIRIEYQDTLAIVTLSQPARGNPIDGDLTRRFKDVAAELWDRVEAREVRGVLMRAEGPNFCYGGDLKSFLPMLDTLPSMVREWTGNFHMGVQRLWQLPVPVVCAVQGFAMGGGVALFAGADVVVAAASARIGSAFAGIGYSCDSGSSVVLTARMGAARARRFVMLAEMLGAAEAEQAGLVDRVVADDQLAAESMALAQKLAAGPTLALGEIKRLFLRAGSAHWAAQLEDEALTLARVAGSADAHEGIRATLERRKPAFKGC